MTIEIVSPDGATGVAPAALASAPGTLAGAVVGVLDNTKPNAGVLLDRIAEGLADRTGARIGHRATKNAAIAASDQVLDGMTKEVTIALTGSAD